MVKTTNGTNKKPYDKRAEEDLLPKAEAIKMIEALREEARDDKNPDDQDEP